MTWIAKYTIEADDENGSWELLSKHLPNSNEAKDLFTQYGNKMKYVGVFLLEHPSRQISENITLFKKD